MKFNTNIEYIDNVFNEINELFSYCIIADNEFVAYILNKIWFATIVLSNSSSQSPQFEIFFFSSTSFLYHHKLDYKDQNSMDALICSMIFFVLIYTFSLHLKRSFENLNFSFDPYQRRFCEDSLIVYNFWIILNCFYEILFLC
jgi:hypothetical protein